MKILKAIIIVNIHLAIKIAIALKTACLSFACGVSAQIAPIAINKKRPLLIDAMVKDATTPMSVTRLKVVIKVFALVISVAITVSAATLIML